MRSSDKDRAGNGIESFVGASSARHKWRVAVMVVVAVLLAAVAMVLSVKINADSDGGKPDKEELFIELDYQDVALQNIHLPYMYEMKGAKNTLSVNLDKVESVYPQNNRVFVVVHGGANLTGDVSGHEKASCEVLLKYSVSIVACEGKLLVRDRFLEKFDAYSNDLNIDSIMETKKMECWRNFQTALKHWECPFAVPFETKESVQLELNGLFIFEK
ncbi:MAG: hypothetical protein KIH06_02990 [Kiritimatiellae bacterium]|nr:hypothetical protein [Kiritimatiellia bacterium]